MGQRYYLTCNVSVAIVNTYQWRKNGSLLSETNPTLIFSYLKLSDAGEYTCEVTVDSKVHKDKVIITPQGDM